MADATPTHQAEDKPMKPTLETLRDQIQAARATAKLLERSREVSMVATKLDEAALWAEAVPGELGHAKTEVLK